MTRDARQEARWLLLIHQLPLKPPYFRVKIWRRLQRLGAVTVKNTVYALPAGDQANEDLEWLVREIVEGGGDASICEARFIHGLSDADVEKLFNDARDEDYRELAEEVRVTSRRLPKRGLPSDELRQDLERVLARFKQRFSEISSIDFFSTSGRESTDALIAAFEARLGRTDKERRGRSSKRRPGEAYKGRTWVTRKGIFVDRIASAWLIRRFVDPEARFKYVNGKGYKPQPGEVRFDMFEAEFTHIGDRCTFEVLLDTLAHEDRPLVPVAEIVHDIDIKDGKFGREQSPGVESLLAGIASTSKSDDERLERGSKVFDDLYEFFRRKRS